MDKKYEKIEFQLGNDLTDVVNELLDYKAKGQLAYGEFNGKKLYSDTVTFDSAYLEVTGKTKSEFEESKNKWHDDYERELKEHEDNIPRLSKEWIEKGHSILTEDKWELWDKIVPIRLGDLYRGMELGCTLELVEMLDINNSTLDEAKEALYNQGHSGMSFGLMCSMLSEFCDKGVEFVNYVR